MRQYKSLLIIIFLQFFLSPNVNATHSYNKQKLAEKLLIWLDRLKGDLTVGKTETYEGTTFKILQKIGEGNFGGVYHIKANQSDFAVKSFVDGREEFALKNREDFLQTSPFFLKLYTQNSFYEVQELGGLNLATLLPILAKHKTIRNTLMTKTLLAVKSLHDRGLAHYDLKWGNIVIASEPKALKKALVKIIDLDEIGPKTNKEKVGTHFYMSAARQIATDEADYWHEDLSFEIGPAEDIYALGIMLLEAKIGCFAPGEKKSHRVLLKRCCDITPQGKTYDELLELSIHERFRHKTNHNELYLSSRIAMYDQLIKKIEKGEISDPEIILAAKAIHPEVKQRISIDRFILEWLDIP